MPYLIRTHLPSHSVWYIDFSCFIAETESHEGKRKQESLWPIFKIHHQKSRYIYDLFYRRKAISRELYNFCLDEKIADKNLIAKWKKPGYENLCCLRCIQTRDTNFGTNCICRVPKGKLEEVRVLIENLIWLNNLNFLFYREESWNVFIADVEDVQDNCKFKLYYYFY